MLIGGMVAYNNHISIIFEEHEQKNFKNHDE
ncbi:hypothetical protein SAMN05421788_10748 [Filimonas lacunae]|uniref:Uncharacterized protein n=1 Tax=Filimonas lacunae TaxID=477680 RepID=A0A1N7QVE5_9BACT|nr:hypothetical protein SAMN05421788_10748 [Filimonas lacunae]